VLRNPDHVTIAVAEATRDRVLRAARQMDYLSRRLRLFEGPEGITLELVQWVEPSSDSR
jgi:hypothetical protein